MAPSAYHPEASNAIPVDSPAVARTHVESFLRRWNEENLQLKLSSENLTKDIRCMLEKASDNLLLFKADMLNYNEVASAIAGCEGVFHVASPVISTKVPDPEAGTLCSCILYSNSTCS